MQGICFPRRCCLSSHDPATENLPCLKTRHCHKILHSVNLVTKPLEHDIMLSHALKLKLLLNLYPVTLSAIKIIRTDCWLIQSNWLWEHTDLLGLKETEFLIAATFCGVLDDFVRPECDCWLASLWVVDCLMGSIPIYRSLYD